MKKVTQSVAQKARHESLETLKSAQKQVFPPKKSPPPSSAPPSPSQNLESIQKKEQELLKKWRSRIAEIHEEEQKLRQERQQQLEAWRKSQEQAMQPSQKSDEQPLQIPQSKPKKGIKAMLKQKMSRTETGRGAKN